VNNLYTAYREEIDQALAKYPADQKRSAVLPLLHMAQRKQGTISQQAIEDIAAILDLEATEVATIIGFYTLFHLEGGRYHIQVCTDLPCALRGAEEFLKQVCEYLGIGVGETTADGLFMVEEVKCLAACHRAPMFQLQGNGEITYHEEQTIDTFKLLVDSLRAQAGKEAGK
jgi:NADH-quinone oxidoreductase subunit E